MSTLAAVTALPAAAAAIWILLRTPLARRVVAAPSAQRWHDVPTPIVGGIGIFAGFTVGIWAAVAVGAVEPSEQLAGIYAGCAILFVAGLVDDVFSLPPAAKVAAQLAAAATVLLTGTNVEIVGNEVIATVLAVAWLVGLTNAFNLLDNMDGLAASLAAIAAGFFAVTAAWQNTDDMVLVVALALGFACIGFLPFNLRPRRRALAFMGDGGSQTIGFALAALGLASSYTAAGTTVATLMLPILVLAVPILDTTLVTIVRLLDGRPVSQGGRDHSSHRLVYLGLSETTAVVLLALVSAALGATSLAYEVLGNGRIAALGVLLTFALLVQFGSFLAAVDRGGRPASGLGVVVAHSRRLVEVLTDGAIISASFLLAYLLRFEGSGTINQRHYFLLTLPVLLFFRFATFIPFGLYGGVWRYAGARDAVAAVAAVAISEVLTVGVIALTQPPFGDFSRSVFVIDAFICSTLIVASRFLERVAVGGLHWLRFRKDATRVLIVGAGRAGRSILRELRDTPGQRVVGFVDDDPRLWGRRINGVGVLGGTTGFAAVLERAEPDTVLVTIPNAPRERLDEVVGDCASESITCRFVRRDDDLDPALFLGATS